MGFLITGVNGCICDSCSEQAHEIVQEAMRQKGNSTDLNLAELPKPKDIKDFLEECKRVAAPIRVKNSQPFQKAYILEHSFFTSHNLDFIVLERIKMMYGIMR